MYNDGGVTDNLWTGYYDSQAQEYVYPDAHQNFVIKFDDFYLSADDGDFTSDGVTITSEVCQTEDITIGNAPAKVLSATMLNPDGLMESLTWGDGTAYIGVVTATAAADTYSSLPCHVYVNSIHYGIDSSGNARRGSTTYTLGGSPVAVIANVDGSDVLFITDTKIGRYNGSFGVVTTPTAAQAFLAAKCQGYNTPLGIALDANGCPTVFNDVSGNTKDTYTYIPMGVYDFSNVDAYGITFNAEAYDKMTLFDADATDWVASLDFTTPKTISGIITELMTEMGMTASVSASAVNTTLSFSANPITAYSCTYRQILKWLAEGIGCNVRIGRTGTVEFWVYSGSSPVATIRPDIIISNTRTKARYTVPQITEVVCYDTLGYNYSSGSSGVPYYIAANPFLQGLDSDTTPLSNLLTLIRGGVPVYYPANVSVACSDPRIDTGDWVTVNTTDGTSPYAIPIMRQTLNWNGTCKANYTASGNQQRAVPSDLVENNLSTTVNGRKILNGVDAKRITVLDEDENVLFNADTETDEVDIAGFTVRDGDFYAHGEEPSSDFPGRNDSLYTTISHWAVEMETDQWEDDNGTPVLRLHQGYFDSDGISFTKNGTPFRTAKVEPGFSGVTGDAGSIRLSANDGEIEIYNKAQTQRAYVRPAEITLEDGTYTKTITADGPAVTYDTGNTTVPTGTGFTECTNFTLTPGTWLISCQANFDSNATGYRRAVLSSTSASGSSVSRTLQGSNAAVNGTYTMIHFASVLKVSANTTYYLNACQTSGANRTCSWGYTYVRLA